MIHKTRATIEINPYYANRYIAKDDQVEVIIAIVTGDVDFPKIFRHSRAGQGVSRVQIGDIGFDIVLVSFKSGKNWISKAFINSIYFNVKSLPAPEGDWATQVYDKYIQSHCDDIDAKKLEKQKKLLKAREVEVAAESLAPLIPKKLSYSELVEKSNETTRRFKDRVKRAELKREGLIEHAPLQPSVVKRKRYNKTGV